MGFLDFFSLFILLVIIVVVVAIILVLAWLPGDLARKRHSPWAEAINIAGWVGILLFPIWMLALIAAFVKPRTGEGAQIAISESETAELAASLASISNRIGKLETGLRELVPKAASHSAGGSQP